MLFRILALDGGGAKGVYTLGVLAEVEALLKKPLCQHFDLIFGTSTGAIIAALLGKGKSVEQIHTLYKTHVPTVMRAGSKWFPNFESSRKAKSTALTTLANTIFEADKFDVFQTGIALVAANWK